MAEAVDTINLGNLNAHFAVPIFHKTGRGVDFAYDLSYDSAIWYPSFQMARQAATGHHLGWRGPTEMPVICNVHTTTPAACFFAEPFGTNIPSLTDIS